MRRRVLRCVLVFSVLVLPCAVATGQVLPPYIQDFELFAACGTSCATPCLLSEGWTNSTIDGTDWLVDVGGTPSSATGPIVDHTLGTAEGHYLYTESSGCNNVSAELLSPVLTVAGSTAPGIRFWYHMYGATMGTLHVDVIEDPNGTPVRTNDVIPAVTGNLDQWQRTACIPLDATAAGGEVQVVVRGVTGSSFTSDMAIDDFEFFDLSGTDAAVVGISGPGCAGSSAVTVTIENRGGADLIDVPLTLLVDGVPQVTEVFPGPLAGCGTAVHTFTTAVLSPGVFDVTVTADLPGDSDPSNDSFTASMVFQPVVTSYPYLDDFEGGNVTWVHGGMNDPWEVGTPAKSVINTANSGLNAWVTGLSAPYQNSTYAWVAGPCVDLSSLQAPRFEAAVWWNSEFSWDGAQLQMTTDGVDWIPVGSVGSGANWYTDTTIVGLAPSGSEEGWSGRNSTANGSGGWVIAGQALPMVAPGSVARLRVAFGSDGSVVDDGFAFDDVRIFDPLAVEVAGALDTGGDGVADPGDVVTYTFTITNLATAGDQTNVAVTDSLGSTVSCPGGNPIPSLAPTEVVVCTGGYAITQEDIDLGSRANTASATSDQIGPVTASSSTPIPQDPAMTLVKTGVLDDGGDGADPGDLIHYSLEVTNGGNVTLTSVALSDPLLSAIACPGGNPIPTVAPGGVVTCTGSYAITAADIALGVRDNTASATSDQVGPVSSSFSTTIPTADLSVSLTDDRFVALPGDRVIYLLTAGNNGPYDAVGVTVEDLFPSLLVDCTWFCTPTGGASCTSGPIDGDIVDVIDLPAGSSAVYGAVCDVDLAAPPYEQLVNTATITRAAALPDPFMANNIATHSDCGPLRLFCAAFEGGDTSEWSHTVP